MSRLRLAASSFCTLLVTGALCGLAPGGLSAADYAQVSSPQQNVMTIIDGTGKEHKFGAWKFVAGTKHLTWLYKGLVPDKIKTKTKLPPLALGPEALEFSEGKLAPLKRRVLSFVPLTSIRSIVFDDKKNVLSVSVATSDQEADDVVFHGVTGYKDVNHFIIEATSDLGELGKGTIRFQHKMGRGLQSARFSAPKAIQPLPEEGRLATIKQVAKGHPKYTAVDIQALYNTSSGLQRALPALHFKDTIKLDLGKVHKIAAAGGGGLDFDVTLTNGQRNSMVLVERPKAEGKGDMFLEGLIGRINGGYRLFPMTTIGELEFDNKDL